MTEEDHIPLLHNVLLAFEPHLGFFLGGSNAACSKQVGAAHDLCADKTFLDITMNFSRCLYGVGALANGPRADLLQWALVNVIRNTS